MVWSERTKSFFTHHLFLIGIRCEGTDVTIELYEDGEALRKISFRSLVIRKEESNGRNLLTNYDMVHGTDALLLLVDPDH